MRRLIVLTCIALCSLAFANAQAVQCQNNIPPSNPDHAYVDHGDGTVTDTRTGLMWKKCSEGQSWTGFTCNGNASTHTWDEALQLTAAASDAGYDDWRLPNITELESLVEVCASDPLINIDVFPNTPSSLFWSASPFASDSDVAWYVDFGYGNSYNYGRDFNLRVRAVRGGQ